MRFVVSAFLLAFVVAGPGIARAQEPVWLISPVEGPVARGFDEPVDRFAAGHRGIDYAVTPGTRVRASAAGTVTFASSVAGALYVTISHGSGLESTYSRLEEVWVTPGQIVEQGTWLGLTGEAHAGTDGLHFGVKLDERYVDPLSMLAPVDVSTAIHLAPLVWEPSTAIPAPLRTALMPRSAGTAARPCAQRQARAYGVVPPNDNIAVAVAGIGSKTKGGIAADMYEQGPELLGY
ncbi:MAG: hypothetical protein QOK47_1274, partial [Actinomycetota bacterium]|nr:hypothetical protein [Actinomycetota bacterium]